MAEVNARGLAERGELFEVLRVLEREVPVGHDAVARDLDGRRQHVAERHRAVALQRQREPGHRAGHRDRAMAEDVGVALDVRPREQRVGDAADDLVHARMRAQRRDGVEVHRDRLAALRAMHQHDARARDGGHEGLDHRHRERRGDGGVDRVAAALEDAGTHAGAERVLCRDHPAAGGRSPLRDDQA